MRNRIFIQCYIGNFLKQCNPVQSMFGQTLAQLRHVWPTEPSSIKDHHGPGGTNLTTSPPLPNSTLTEPDSSLSLSLSLSLSPSLSLLMLLLPLLPIQLTPCRWHTTSILLQLLYRSRLAIVLAFTNPRRIKSLGLPLDLFLRQPL
jgi:hypothetical protein